MPLVVVVKSALFLLLSFSHFTLPCSFLAAVTVGFGRLAGDSELIGLAAVGMSWKQRLFPVWILSLGVAIVSLILGLSAAPWGERRMTELLYRAGMSKPVPFLKERSFITDFYGLVLYFDHKDNHTNELQNIFIYDQTQSENPTIIVAQNGRLLESAENQDANAKKQSASLHLTKGTLQNSKPDLDGNSGRAYFTSYDIRLNQNIPEWTLPDDMPRIAPLSEVLRKIDAFPTGSREKLDYALELSKRISLGIAPIAFVLLGVGAGSLASSRRRGGGTVVAFAAAIIYWTVLSFMSSEAYAYGLEPYFALEVPNLILAGLGFGLFKLTCAR
jgi:lipopolysaccharide export system permease protein